MPFHFNLPSRNDIENSFDGDRILRIIEDRMPGMEGRRHLLLTGCPGTGKTTVTVRNFIHNCNRGDRVQLVTYQKMLHYAIRHILAREGIPNPNVETACKWLNHNTGCFLFNDQEHAVSTIEEMRAAFTARLPGPPFTKFYIDEGQDVHQNLYHALPQIALHVMVGADDAQQMYTDGATEDQIRAILTANGGLWHSELQYNYRNTFETYEFARQFVPDMPRANAPATLDLLRQHRTTGPENRPRVFVYRTQQQMKDRLQRLFAELRGTNVALLTRTQAEVNTIRDLLRTVQLDGRPLEFSVYHNKLPVPHPLHEVLVTTYKSAKGMEFDSVVLPFLPPGQGLSTRRECFVACTRAKAALYVFCQNPMPPNFLNFRPDTYQKRLLYEVPT